MADVEVIGTRYAYSRCVRPKVVFDPKSDRSMTNQADKDGADINKIMARYEKTGNIVDLLSVSRQPVYGDFSGIKDYHSLLSSLKRVQQAFDVLPSKVRDRFGNDPQQLIDFLDKKENAKEAFDLGLLTKEQFEAAVPPTVAPPGGHQADGKPKAA